MDPPTVNRQRYLGERPLPGEHVRVNGVDKGAVEIEDERPLSPRQAEYVIGSAVLPGVEIDVVDPPRGGARGNELERDGVRCEDSGQIRQQQPSRADGCHVELDEIFPPSRMLRTPSRLFPRTRTWSDENELEELAAKKRMCQSPGAKHIAGVVAELPLGMKSEWLSETP